MDLSIEICSCCLNNRHLGNVLVRETPLKTLKFFEFPSFKSHGILCTIIDYSLSSFNYKDEFEYRDLGDSQWLFDGEDKVNTQYQVYKDMRDITQGKWSDKCTKTNILWLDHILFTVVGRLSKIQKHEFSKLQQRIKTYDSCVGFVFNDEFFK